MSNVQPIYPNSTFTWTDRIDNQDVDFAEDINAVAAEVISVEKTFGVNPQIESNPPTGTPVSYATANARISDAVNNKLLPVCELINPGIVLNNVSAGTLNTYKVNYDPFNMFNGVDLTLVANGWWIITATQTWFAWDDGYSHMRLCLNGTSNTIDEFLLNWQFPGNAVVSGVAQRWQRFGTRPITTSVHWQGLAHTNDRISVVSENGTSNSSHIVSNLSLKASMLRTVPGTFTSG